MLEYLGIVAWIKNRPCIGGGEGEVKMISIFCQNQHFSVGLQNCLWPKSKKIICPKVPKMGSIRIDHDYTIMMLAYEMPVRHTHQKLAKVTQRGGSV